VLRASPYRIQQPPPAAPEAVSRPTTRGRFSLSRGAWAASFAAHAAVAFAVALAQTPLNPTEPSTFEEPPSTEEGFSAPVDQSRPAFPFAIWPEVWFDGIGPHVPSPPDPRDDRDLPYSDAVGCPAGAPDGWARIDLSELAFPDHDAASRLVGDAARRCADQAAQAGWAGRGRVFVRVDRHDDGAAIATTTPLGDDARNDTLLCCLRQAQAPVVSMLRPGGAVRFVLVFSMDPAQGHVRVEHTASSRQGNGPEALVALQGAFLD
jgi:hypothetical protein